MKWSTNSPGQHYIKQIGKSTHIFLLRFTGICISRWQFSIWSEQQNLRQKAHLKLWDECPSSKGVLEVTANCQQAPTLPLMATLGLIRCDSLLLFAFGYRTISCLIAICTNWAQIEPLAGVFRSSPKGSLGSVLVMANSVSDVSLASQDVSTAYECVRNGAISSDKTTLHSADVNVFLIFARWFIVACRSWSTIADAHNSRLHFWFYYCIVTIEIIVVHHCDMNNAIKWCVMICSKTMCHQSVS